MTITHALIPDEALTYIHAITLSVDERAFITAHSHNWIRYWDVGTGRCFRAARLSERGDPTIRAIRATPHHLLLHDEDGAVRAWTFEGLEPALSLRARDERVEALATAPDGAHLATGTVEGLVKIRDLLRGGAPRPFRPHRAAITQLDYSPDGLTLATASLDGSARLCDLRGPRPKTRALQGHSARLRSHDGARPSARAVLGLRSLPSAPRRSLHHPHDRWRDWGVRPR